MHRSLLTLALLLPLAIPASARDRDGDRDHDHDARREKRAEKPRPAVVARPARPAVPAPGVVIKFHRVVVPRTPPVKDPSHIVRDDRRVEPPARDGRGAPIVKPPASRPPDHHRQVARDERMVHGIEERERSENQAGRHYWHEDRGVTYSHYYDGRVHWYGFYHGPTFYWTRYHARRWWWYDSVWARWVYWGDGFWWWPGPAGVAYVYVDGQYYPYVPGSPVVVAQPEVVAPAAEVPAYTVGVTTTSADGARMVQVAGLDSGAFLYDATATPPVFMKFLGKGAQSARFSGGTAGAPVRIMLQFLDGTFALFDADGNPLDSAAAAGAADAEPPADLPDSVPPPPTSAPGR